MQQRGNQRRLATARMPHYSYVADLTSSIRFHEKSPLKMQSSDIGKMWVPQVSPLRPGRHSRQHKPRNRIWPQGTRVGVQLGVLVAPPSQEVETSAAERSHSGTSAVLRHADNPGRRASKTESFARASSLKKTKPITTRRATSMSDVTGCAATFYKRGAMRSYFQP